MESTFDSKSPEPNTSACGIPAPPARDALAIGRCVYLLQRRFLIGRTWLASGSRQVKNLRYGATNGARVCDPQKLCRPPSILTNPARRSLSTCCGSQSRAPQNRRGQRRFGQILITASLRYGREPHVKQICAGCTSVGKDHFLNPRTNATSALISSSESVPPKAFIFSLPFLSFIPSLICLNICSSVKVA